MPEIYDMTNVAAKSGRILGEDGKVYNLVDLLQSTGGGGVDPEQYYTKDEIDAELSKKANSSSLSNKADKSALESLQQMVDDLQSEVDALKGEG